MDEFAAERRQMVTTQIARRGLCEPRLLAAFEDVPRHRFVQPEWRPHAYRDCALPIGLGQTISQPYIVALMTDLLCLGGVENVLEVGTGSGYQAAILCRMAARVQTIEYDPRLAERAKKLLDELGFENVHFRQGDGSNGWPEAAPFDGILVTAFAQHVPPPLLEQLSEGGRLVMPVGTRSMQTLEMWTRMGERFQRQRIVDVAFVPLRGKFGWRE